MIFGNKNEIIVYWFLLLVEAAWLEVGSHVRGRFLTIQMLGLTGKNSMECEENFSKTLILVFEVIMHII